MKNYHKRLDHEDIDEFRDHLNKSFDKKLDVLQKRLGTATIESVEDPRGLQPYKHHLEDIMINTYSSKLLGYELSIIALYKRVEIKTGKVIKDQLSVPDSKKLSFFKNVCEVLPFDIETVNGYNSFNELRLLNNSIKHGGIVTDELEKHFPNWQTGDELKDLGQDYNRLLPGVKNYVYDLVEKLYAHNQVQP